MTKSDSTTRLVKTVVATTVMLLVGWFVAPSLSHWYSGQLAQRLVAKIAVAEDAKVKVPLRQLASLGDPATESLVVAAASPRAAVATIARQILDEKLATWQMRSGPAFKRNSVESTTTLATALAKHIDKFGPAGKLWAERSAFVMIGHADTLPAVPTRTLLADCSRILDAVPPRGPRLRTMTPLTKFDDLPASVALDAPQPKLDPLTRSSESSLEALARLRTNPRLEFRGRLPQIPPPSTKSSLLPTQSFPTDPNWSPRWKDNFGKQPSVISSSAPADSRETTSPLSATNSPVVDIPTPQDMQKRADALRQVSSDELLLRLNTTDFYELGILRTVLGERGFADLELAMLQRLASPEVADRRQLFEDLSALPASTARRLLRGLLEDKNADIRLRALTALATTNAPDLAALARERAVRDDDPRVAELAARLLRQAR